MLLIFSQLQYVKVFFYCWEGFFGSIVTFLCCYKIIIVDKLDGLQQSVKRYGEVYLIHICILCVYHEPTSAFCAGDVRLVCERERCFVCLYPKISVVNFPMKNFQSFFSISNINIKNISAFYMSDVTYNYIVGLLFYKQMVVEELYPNTAS